MCVCVHACVALVKVSAPTLLPKANSPLTTLKQGNFPSGCSAGTPDDTRTRNGAMDLQKLE